MSHTITILVTHYTYYLAPMKCLINIKRSITPHISIRKVLLPDQLANCRTKLRLGLCIDIFDTYRCIELIDIISK